jgi:hypothetical protein
MPSQVPLATALLLGLMGPWGWAGGNIILFEKRPLPFPPFRQFDHKILQQK